MIDAGSGTSPAAESRTRALHRGLVELIPEPEGPPAPHPARSARLRRNLADTACRLLFAGACLAQIGDAVTTAIGLNHAGVFEANSLMRHAVTAPFTVGLLKLAMIGLLSLLAMLRLPTPRARVALLLAMSLGLIAPIQNVIQILAAR